MMTEMKNWLSGIRESEEIMDRIDPIPTAMLPPPKIELTGRRRYDEEAEALAHAAKLVEGFKTQRAQLETIWPTMRALKDSNRENELLGLDLAQAKNDLQTLAADLETKRQEISDLLAYGSEQLDN